MWKKYNNIITKYLDSILIFTLCIFIFTFMVKYVSTDIQLHVDKIVQVNLNRASYSPNFLFYFIVNLISGFSNNISLMYGITIVLLSIATAGKYLISKNIIIDFSTRFKVNFVQEKIYLIALGLFFCFAIPDFYNIFILKKMYLGRFVPTVWHNSTTIFLFPFAILLFWKQLAVLAPLYKSTIKDILTINTLVVINVLIKPSFIFVYIPVTFFMLLNKIKTESFKKNLFNLAPIFIGSFIILFQYILIYNFQIGYHQEETSSVQLSSPFQVLLNWIPIWYLPISILLSFALPIFTMLLFKELLKFRPFLYALFLTITGILISAIIKESGPRVWHGNFMWQNIICSFLLILTTVSFLTPKFLDKNRMPKKVLFLIGIFFLHSISGILYLLKIGLTLSYR